MKTRSPTYHFRAKVSILRKARRKLARHKRKTVWPCKVLIVPVDFSEESEGAIDWAVSLAKQTGARVILVHVIESRKLFNARAPVYRAWDKCVIADAKEKLARLLDKNSTASVRLQAKLRIGRPARELSSLAHSSPGSLIVIGTHGFKGLKHSLLGSTTENVVRYAPVPVLVVHQRSDVNTSTLFKPKTFSSRQIFRNAPFTR